MRKRSQGRSRAGFRRSRHLRHSRRGVVAVVGTLLALLVFFALFGVFITQYVPLWMEENESQLSNGIISSLSTLKSGMDDQYLLPGIPTYSVPFTVSSQSVPLLAQPTVATLGYETGCPAGLYSSNQTPERITACAFEHLTYTTGVGATGSQRNPFSQTAATNYLEVTVPNRYYPAATYFFEDDAILGAQANGHQWVLVPPPLNITNAPGNVSVQSSFLVLTGNASTFTGEGSKDVTSHFDSRGVASSHQRFLTPAGAARKFNVTLTIGVYDLCGWFSYLHNLTTNSLGSSGWTLTWTAGKTASSVAPAASVCALGESETYDLALEITGVTYASTFIAQDALTFNAGGL